MLGLNVDTGNILEMARALKIQSGLPIAYWGECVLTAMYVINRLPSSVLQNKCPYEVLYKCLPVYEDLKAFGCLGFTATSLTSTDKLDI